MKKKQIAVYLRVSTVGQNLAAQEPDLKKWLRTHGRGRPVRWYRDTFTGKTLSRPGMQALEADLRAAKVDALVVWRLDRLGRTAREMLAFLDDLERAGVEFVSVRDGVEARSATGRLMRTILAGFAEYEREVISERVRAGIAKAKSQGKRWGGKSAGQRYRLSTEKLDAMKELLAAGKKKAAIARQLGISRTSVYRGAQFLGLSGENATRSTTRKPSRIRSGS
ncbi:MAG: recombinase family protein [Acidobacteriia bacterium]|nr:recombinase family protein [Terriglobia bacterium]